VYFLYQAQQRQQESEAALVQEREAMKMASEQLKELHQEKVCLHFQ
jgi:hypothetical protein